MIALSEGGRRRVNFSHAFRNCRNGFIHHNIFGRFDDLELRDVTVFFDSNLYERRNFSAGSDRSRWLDPCAVKTIMQHVAIPPEFRCVAWPARTATFAD